MDTILFPQQIRVKYRTDAAGPLEQAHQGEWIDLRCAETVELAAHEFKYISLGVNIEVPKGYEAIMVPRSSTFNKYGILQTNSIGVIDHDYCGEDDVWMMPAYAVRDTRIEAGERIAQFRIQRINPIDEIIEVNQMNNANRGGLGSTGRV